MPGTGQDTGWLLSCRAERSTVETSGSGYGIFPFAARPLDYARGDKSGHRPVSFLGAKRGNLAIHADSQLTTVKREPTTGLQS